MFGGNLRRREQRHGVPGGRRRYRHGHDGRPSAGEQRQNDAVGECRDRRVVRRERLPVPVHTAHAGFQGRLAHMRGRLAR